eukprot:712323_1
MSTKKEQYKSHIVLVMLIIPLIYSITLFDLNNMTEYDQLPVITAYMTNNICNSILNDSQHIHFLTQPEMNKNFKYKYPTFLFSVPGAGNTFVRLILEYLTNIWTGSIYGDQ